MATHRQARISAPEWHGQQRVSVDAEMAPLLRELWRRSYMTWASCQDWGDGTAQIVFYSEQMARAFCYEAVGLADGDGLPAGWRREMLGVPWPGFPPLCAIWFPRELLARFNARHSGSWRRARPQRTVRTRGGIARRTMII
jgi:hypothetical protein